MAFYKNFLTLHIKDLKMNYRKLKHDLSQKLSKRIKKLKPTI